MLEQSAFAEESSHRSLVLLLIGAAAGLALAGYSLFTAAGSTTQRIPEGAIARVNTGRILLTDYRAQLEALYDVPLEKATPEQRKAVLDAMIAEELMVQRGLDIELPATDTGVREALVAGVQRTTLADIEAKQPDDAELRAYFDLHRDQYRSTGMMLLRDLVAPAQAMGAAQQAAQAVRKGTPADLAAARFGLKPSPRPTAEEQPDIAISRALGKERFAIAEKLQLGQASDPIADADGVHVLVMVQRRPSVPLEFDAARERVAADMKREARTRAQDDYVKFLRGKAEILVAPGYAQ